MRRREEHIYAYSHAYFRKFYFFSACPRTLVKLAELEKAWTLKLSNVTNLLYCYCIKHLQEMQE